MAGRLEGKVAIITGGAGGQGSAYARQFVAEGASVVIADLIEEAGHAIADELGERAQFARLDVTDEAGWAKTLAIARDGFGRLDTLVNNAGIVSPGTIADTKPADFARHLEVNLLGAFLGIQACAPSMIEVGGGSIINISSSTAVAGVARASAYASSKWGLRGLTKSAAVELAPVDIRVNAVLPGVINTPMISHFDAEAAAVRKAMIPLGRFGETRDLSALIAFLASDDGAYMTGADLLVDGGLNADHWPGLQALLRKSTE